MTATTRRLHDPVAPGPAPVRTRPTATAPAGPPTAATVLDQQRGRRLAERWAAEHLPEREVVGTRTHTAYYRGRGEVSVRVSVELDAGTDVTLLVRHPGERVQPFPCDPDLPTLAPLLRPEVAEALVVEHLGVPHPHWCTVSVVHHPRTGACVLRYEFADRSDGTDRAREVYLKVYPTAEAAAAAAARLTSLGAHLLTAPDGSAVRLPRLLAHLPSRQAVVLESVRVPHRLGSPTPGEAGAALAALHRHRPAGPLPVVSAADRLAALEAELALVRGPWPEVANRVDAALEPVRRLLGHPGHSTPVLSHGDFTPSQVLRRPDGLAVVDLDTLCLAEPAADLGRFLAYRALAAAREERRAVPPPAGPPARPRVGSGDFLAGYGQPDVPPMELSSRVLAYRSLNLAHVALNAARRFKEERTALALALLEQARPTEGAFR
jgi:hypothetical protein